MTTGSFPASSTMEKYPPPQFFFTPAAPTPPAMEDVRRKEVGDLPDEPVQKATEGSPILNGQASQEVKQAKRSKDQDADSEKTVKKIVKRRKQRKQTAR